MEQWEYFLRGLGRTIEGFIIRMIERGNDVEKIQQPVSKPTEESIPEYQADIDLEEYSAPDRPSKRRFIPRRELGDLEEKIYNAFAQFPDGCTLKELAKVMDMQWHFLRIPLRQLVGDGKVLKDGKNYKAVQKPVSSPVSSPTPAVSQASSAPSPLTTPMSAPIPFPEKNGVRRRVVDARVLDEDRSGMQRVEKSDLSAREKEILRFKILTAFKGRPEGLTMMELAAVLGRSIDGLDPIVQELINEKKVAESKGGKYHLA